MVCLLQRQKPSAARTKFQDERIGCYALLWRAVARTIEKLCWPLLRARHCSKKCYTVAKDKPEWQESDQYMARISI